MPVHHVKGQPAASTYVREKGGVKKPVDPWTPCITPCNWFLPFLRITDLDLKDGRMDSTIFENWKFKSK